MNDRVNTIKWWFGNILHNCIAHPLMPFLPERWGNAFHDWTITRFWSPNEPHEETK